MASMLLFVTLCAVASASFFRFGTITWEKLPHTGPCNKGPGAADTPMYGCDNSVRFTIETAWRRSYDGNYKLLEHGGEVFPNDKATDSYPVLGDVIEVNGLEWPTFETGDGLMQYVTLTVTAFSAEEDWFYGVSTIDHTYATPSNAGSSWIPRFTGCCRMSNLYNNKDRTWNLVSSVNLLTDTYSPNTNALPIVTLAAGSAEQKFYMPSTTKAPHVKQMIDTNADKFEPDKMASSWRLATSTELGGSNVYPAVNPIGVRVNSANGEVAWDTTGYKDGLYNIGLVAYHNNAQTPIDMLVRLVEVQQPATLNTLGVDAVGDLYKLYPQAMSMQEYTGFEIKYTVKGADAGAGKRVGFTWGMLPRDMALSTIKGVNAVQQVATWTPCTDDRGFHAQCFEAVYENGVTSSQDCHVEKVNFDPAPRFLKPCVVLGGGNEDHIGGHGDWTAPTAYIGEELVFTVAADDVNHKDSLVIEENGSHAACRNADAQWPAGAEMGPAKSCSGDFLVDGDSTIDQRLNRIYADTNLDVNKGTCTHRVFSWVPRWDQGGWNGKICYKVTDSCGGCDCAGVATVTTLCAHVTVKRCQYAVQHEQHLEEISAIFATDWINTWQLNTDMLHPDNVLTVGSHIAVGHVYKVNLRDTVAELAERFGTSVTWIHHMNADLCLDNDIDVDQEICIITNSCHGAVDTVHTQFVESAQHDHHWYSRAKDAYTVQAAQYYPDLSVSPPAGDGRTQKRANNYHPQYEVYNHHVAHEYVDPFGATKDMLVQEPEEHTSVGDGTPEQHPNNTNGHLKHERGQQIVIGEHLHGHSSH